VAALGLRVPVVGLFAAHPGYTFRYCSDPVDPTQGLDRAKEKLGVSAEGRCKLEWL